MGAGCALALQRLGGCAVGVALYESTPHDDNFGRHYDEWYLVAVQVEGAKEWWIGDDTRDGGTNPTITMCPGDVLCLPQGVQHDIRTPGPADSRHLAVSIITDHPLEAL